MILQTPQDTAKHQCYPFWLIFDQNKRHCYPFLWPFFEFFGDFVLSSTSTLIRADIGGKEDRTLDSSIKYSSKLYD